MNHRGSLILLVTLCIPMINYAQNISLLNSTFQSWSGGIAGRSGDNYTFIIEFSGYKTEPKPDTIWIGQQPVQILLQGSYSNQYPNTKVARTKNSIKFNISAGTSNDEYADRYPVQGKQKTKPHAPKAYKGVALLSYRYRGKQHYYEIIL